MSQELKNISEIREYKKIKRRKTKKIFVGDVAIGGDEVIKVQSMTNSLTILTNLASSLWAGIASVLKSSGSRGTFILEWYVCPFFSKFDAIPIVALEKAIQPQLSILWTVLRIPLGRKVLPQPPLGLT